MTPTPTRWPLPCGLCGDYRHAGMALVDTHQCLVACPACLLVDDDDPVCDASGAWEGLRPYQREGVSRLAGSRGLLLADDPGLGKTAQALRALVARGHPPAIAVVMPSLRRQWAGEAARWSPGYRVQVWDGGWCSMPQDGSLLVCGYTQARSADWRVARGTVVVLDEAQAIKNPRAKQARGVSALCALPEVAAVWLLTATPAYGHVAEAWQVLMAAGLGRQLAPTRWAAEVSPEATMRRELERVMLRRRIRDVANDLPELEIVQRRVELPAEALHSLDQESRRTVARARLRSERRAASDTPGDTESWWDEAAEEEAERMAQALSDSDVADALAALAEGSEAPLATLRKAVAVAKIPAAHALAAEVEDTGEPVVVFSAHRAPAIAMGARPGWEALPGGLGEARKQELVDRFARGELRGLGGTIGAMGTGTDGLHRVCRRGIFVDRDWTPALNEQARGRLLRLGSVGGGVLIWELIADHAADEIVTDALSRKARHLAAVGL